MKEKNTSIVNIIIDGISGIFLPIVNLLSAAGILKGILAFTAARKFGPNPFTAIVIGGVLLYPTLTAVFEAGIGITFAGLPIKAVTYHSSVIPIILAVGLLKYVEHFTYKLLPDMVKGFLTPLICIVVVELATLFVFGPIGTIIGDVLAAGYEFVYGFNPVIAGAALAVCLKSKDKRFKSICVSAALSACFGITEPAMFGVNLPLKKPMIAVCIGGGIGGALAGFSGAQAMTFAFPSLAVLPI